MKLALKTSRSEMGGSAPSLDAGAVVKESSFASSHASKESKFEVKPTNASRFEMGELAPAPDASVAAKNSGFASCCASEEWRFWAKSSLEPPRTEMGRPAPALFWFVFSSTC